MLNRCVSTLESEVPELACIASRFAFPSEAFSQGDRGAQFLRAAFAHPQHLLAAVARERSAAKKSAETRWCRQGAEPQRLRRGRAARRTRKRVARLVAAWRRVSAAQEAQTNC